jgi:hypothetical protein
VPTCDIMEVCERILDVVNRRRRHDLIEHLVQRGHFRPLRQPQTGYNRLLLAEKAAASAAAAHLATARDKPAHFLNISLSHS